MTAGEIGKRHLKLLRVAADLARNDPAAVAQMYRVAQRMNLNTVGKQADRAEFLGLVRDLEEAGCVEVRGAGLAASYGMLCVTKEGHRQLKEPTQEPPAKEPVRGTGEPERVGSGSPREEASERPITKQPRLWSRLFGGWGDVMAEHENFQELLTRLNNIRDSMEEALGYVRGIEDDYRRGPLEAHI
jgi:hypothetical protein